MCGRFTLSADKETLEEVFPGVSLPALCCARFNIAPSQPVAVIRTAASGQKEAITARWGLIPYWADDPAIGNRLINARSEGIENKPAFREPFRRRRCLVPADGFYEWQKIPGSRAKRPIFFRIKGGRVFAFAGVWDLWRRGGEEVTSFAIITCPANELVGRVHERMPVILPEPEQWEQWLKLPAEEVRELLRPLSPGVMEAWAVSPRVNDPAVDDPGCIDKVADV